GKTFSEESLHRVEIILEEQIRKSCELAFQKAVKKYQSDVFYLGDMVWRDQPELWEKLQKNWKENSSQVVLLYEIHVNIDRTGLAETLSQ
ncbi:MAG: Ger(x)C family spore germination C-terminal domain-containing protein, partial [Oscillospiraceae bacterium]